MHLSSFLIPVVTACVGALVSNFAAEGLGTWYGKARLPSWMPSGPMMGLIWATVFIMTTISALLLWHAPHAGGRLLPLGVVFLVNAALHVWWSHSFFMRHALEDATWQAIDLALTVLALIVIAWPIKPVAVLLLLPYAAAASGAAYLSFTVSELKTTAE